MPVLDRQAIRAATSGGRVIDRVAETAPTPLQRHYILLSAPALLAGFIAITAIEIGVAPSSLLVKL
ncbi:MAG TPA: hypothetical protein VF484_11310, partial [Candidatus Limnocylindrales bacterium]